MKIAIFREVRLKHTALDTRSFFSRTRMFARARAQTESNVCIAPVPVPTTFRFRAFVGRDVQRLAALYVPRVVKEHSPDQRDA